mgnify:CR=1 FL=1
MKLALNTESATALREFAEAMPLAIDNIAESTEEVVQVYQSVAVSYTHLTLPTTPYV